MYREIQAKIHKETKEGTYFYVLVPQESLTDEVKKLSNNGILKGELRIDDGRHITAEQRKKAYATLADIAAHLGYPPEELKEIMKYRYIAASGEDYFSFSDCSISTARHFINHIIDFALEWNIPLMDSLLERTDDINAAIYASLKHKRCIVCGGDGETYQCDSKAGYEKVMCLCGVHRAENHRIGHLAFEEKYHVYGIIFKG